MRKKPEVGRRNSGVTSTQVKQTKLNGVTPCNPVEVHRGNSNLLSSDTSANFYPIIWRHISEDSTLRNSKVITFWEVRHMRDNSENSKERKK
jgi:hypothetical protein